jgi:hypothetical protein
MKTVVVQARAPFSYQGRGLRAGELVTMTPIDAAAAARHGLVSLTRLRRSAEAPIGDPPKSKRRYKRRDLEAEST